MTTSTCLCHFPDGTEAIREVDGNPFSRGSQITIDGDASPWYVEKHTPTAVITEETIARPYDSEIWISPEAPPEVSH